MVLAAAAPLALLLGCSLLLVAPAARAYRRSHSDRGAALYWRESEIRYVIDEAGCADVSDDSDLVAMRTSFATWSSVSCTDGPICLSLVDGGLVQGRAAGFSPEGPNENLLIFIDDVAEWRDRGYSMSAIAMTLVTHDQISGRIYDTDVEFNDAGFRFTTHNLPVALDAATQDIRNTTTHEIGHMLGLDHSSDVNATMYSEAQPGERKKRTLNGDDIDGICAIMPPCSPEAEVDDCRVATPARAWPPRALLLLGAGLLLVLGLRRQRRR